MKGYVLKLEDFIWLVRLPPIIGRNWIETFRIFFCNNLSHRITSDSVSRTAYLCRWQAAIGPFSGDPSEDARAARRRHGAVASLLAQTTASPAVDIPDADLLAGF